jgi:hypothetical protein
MIHLMTRSLLLRTLPPALFALSLSANAQSSDVRVKVKADLNAQPDREIGVAKMVYGDEGSFVALKTKGATTVIGGVPDADLNWQLAVIGSDKMQEIKHDKPKFVWGIGPVAMETIESFNKKFHVILSKPDPKYGQLLLLDQVLSPRSLTGRAAAMITGIPYDRFGKGPEYFKDGMAVGFTTTPGADGKHLWIGLSPTTTVRSAGCPILGVMVDANMKPVWMNALSTAPGNVRTDVVTTTVDKGGRLWLLVRNVTDAAPKTKEDLGYNYTLYRMDSLGQKEFPLTLGKKDFVQDAAFAILPDGRLTCAGTFSNNDHNRDESIGIFQMFLDTAAGKWSMAERTPFEPRMVKKVERLQNNMHLEQIWPRKDGGLYVVAMRSGMETHQVSDLSGKKVEKTEWVNGAFHVMELGKTGEKKWYTVLPREMSYANNGPGMAFSISAQDVLFIFYNDAASNIELRKKKQDVEPVDKPKEALMVEFKPDGGFKEKVVLQDGMKQGYFNADHLWPMASGLYGVLGAPDFKKDRSFPILIELGGDTRR